MSQTRKPTTMAQVATLAGVSPGTVSHVLSGKQPVAPTTRQRVERAIAETGYRPNHLARSLRLQRTNTIALIVPDITNTYYTVLARGLDDALEGRYRTLICFTDGRRDREIEFIADAVDRHVDGIVLIAFRVEPADVVDILARGTPVVSMGEGFDDDRFDVVGADDEHGAALAVSLLIRLGHRRIGLISGAGGPGAVRTAGYHRALSEADIPVTPELAATSDWTRAGGAAALERLLELRQPPTAVFCTNDLMAIGAMDTARAAGLTIPDDLAVVGYDDVEAAALVHPPLTTIVNPAYEAGREAGRLLLDRIEGGYTGGGRSVLLRTRLIERGSS